MSEGRKVRGSYVAGTVTRESILEVSMRLIAENGYYGFSLRDVARLVGISHPAVIYHFPTKETLLFSASQRCEDALGIFKVAFDSEAGELVEDGLRAESLGELGLGILELGRSRDYRTLTQFDLTMAVEAASPNHPLHTHYQYKFVELERFLTAGIEKLHGDGISELDIKPQALARYFVASFYGAIASEKYLVVEEDSADSVGHFLAMVGRALGLKSDAILSIAVAIPEDLANIFQRVIKTNQSLNL